MKAATGLVVELRRIGLDVWVDREHPPPDSTPDEQQAGPTPKNPLFRHLVSAISESDAAIYIASPSSFASEYVRFEFDPRILYQEFRKHHPDKNPKNLPLYIVLIEPIVVPPGIFILGLDSAWSGRIINLTGTGATPLTLPAALTTMIREVAPDRLYPLNPTTEWFTRKMLEDRAEEAPGCPPGVSAITWLRLEGYFGLGPLFPGPFSTIDEDQLRYGMYRTGDAARIVDASSKMMIVPKEVSTLLALWTANMMLRSSLNRIFDGKDLSVEHNLPSCLKGALEQSNEELAMAIRLQFAFGLLSSPKKIDKVLAAILLRHCKLYFEKLGSTPFTALLDVLYSYSKDKQFSEDSVNTIKSIGIEPRDTVLPYLYHSLLDAAFPGPRLEATEEYRSTIMSFKDKILESSAEFHAGFAKAGEDKLSPEYWEKIEPLNEWYAKGSSLAASGRYDKAVECFDKALEIDQNNLNVLNSKGLALESVGRHKEAIEQFDKAMEIKSDYYFAHGNKGLILLNLEKYNEAIEQFDKALEINPRDAEIWHNKGRSLVFLKDYNKAVECFDKALEINPAYTSCLALKGSVLNILTNYKEAVECFDKALEINPRDPEIWYNRGLSFLSSQKYNEAVECFDIALEINPDDTNSKEFRDLAQKNKPV
jgi:tetratricopeptide (TPR) repeat protein